MDNKSKTFSQGLPQPELTLRQRHGDTAAAMEFLIAIASLDPATTKANLNFYRGKNTVQVALKDDRNEAKIDIDLYRSIRTVLRSDFAWAVPKIDDAIAAQGPSLVAWLQSALPGPKPT